MSAFSSIYWGWNVEKWKVGGISSLGCQGGGPRWCSTQLALWQALWRRWWLSLLVVWAPRG